MIAMQVSVPAGSAFDPAGKPGLASFAAALLDEGAGSLDSKAYHDALADKAIELAVTTGRDWLDISLICETAAAPDAFRLLGLALQHPRFDADAIARVRAQMLENIADEDEEPETVASKAFYNAYFRSHPYGHPSDGTARGIAAVGQADLRAFAHTHWVRGGLKIAVAGDIKAPLLSHLLLSAFGRLSPAFPPAPPAFRPGSATPVLVKMDSTQSSAVFGLPALPRSDPRYIPAYVANSILGGKFSSRLSDEVRVKLGLTYDISTDVETDRAASLIVGTVATRSDSIGKTVSTIQDVLKRFSSDGPTPEELADAKSYLTGSFPLAFASDASIAYQLSQFEQEDLPESYFAQRNALVEAVTLADVREAARQLFDPSRMVVVVAGSAPAESVAKRGTGH